MMARVLWLGAALAVAACTPAPSGPPTSSTTFLDAGPNRGIQTPNSLPQGATTSSPFAPATGVYGTTKIGP